MDELSIFNNKPMDGLEFCKKVYSLLENIRSTSKGISDLRMRASIIEKKLLEELIPICKYIQTKYRVGRYLTVCWVNGNQQFDAKVTEKGSYIEQGAFPENSYLEVTCSVHPNDYLARERLDKDGYCYGYGGLRRNKDGSIESVATSYSGLEFIKEDSEYIVKIIEKKCNINYPENTTLIVQSSLSTVYSPEEWNKVIEHVKNSIMTFPFKEIFICDSNHIYTGNINDFEKS